MTPKEQANQLVFKFTVFDYQVNGFKHITEMEHEAAKRCAVMCVDEILRFRLNVNYWEEVKYKITKL
jgi:hypothetical protein